MQKTIFLGDIHFRDDYLYFYEAGQAFIEYIRNHPYNTPENTFVFLGDITDKFYNTSKVNQQVIRLMTAIKAKKVVLVGNHDLKIHLEHKKSFTSYDYLEDLGQDTQIIDRPTTIKINGLNILCFPHYYPESLNLPPMKTYYEGDTFKGANPDVLIGHIGDKDSGLFETQCVSLDHIGAKQIILGHIHKVMSPNYIGSIWPNSVSENGQRFIKIYENGVWSLEEIPKFLEFYNILFPEEIQETPAKVSVYTVYNCLSEDVAKSHYGDIHVRKTSPSLTKFTEANKGEKSIQKLTDYLSNTGNILEAFLKANPKEPEIEKLLRKYYLGGAVSTSDIEVQQESVPRPKSKRVAVI